MLKWGCISQGWYQQGQIGPKQLKISCFWWFFYIYVHLSCLWWLETYLDPNTDLYQNNPKKLQDNNKRVGGVIPHRPQHMVSWVAKSEVNIILAKAAKTSYYHQFFIDNLTLLWPWDDLIIWSERNYRNNSKKKIFSAFFSCFDLAVILRWPWDIPRSLQCQNITSVCYFIYFCHIRHKGDLKGVWKTPPTLMLSL